MILDQESYQLLKDSAAEWLADNASVEYFRKQRDSHGCVAGQDYWQEMAALGWAGIMVPEELGGLGLGMSELGAIIEHSGRNLTASPLLSTGLIAVAALSRCSSSELAQAALPQIAGGEITVALAVDEGRHHNPTKVAATARMESDQWLLSGQKTQVADAAGADAFLVTARCEEDDSLGLFWVPKEAVSVQPLQLIDSRDHGNIQLGEATVASNALLVKGDDCVELLNDILDRACIGLATEMLGSAWAAFEMTIEYLKIREQFGQFIGSYQALQHRAAKMYIDLELCQTVINAALRAVDDNSPDVSALASQAKALVGDMLKNVTNEALQLHGGIGITDEHDAGLFLKRARVAESLYGSASYHRDRFARLRGF